MFVQASSYRPPSSWTTATARTLLRGTARESQAETSTAQAPPTLDDTLLFAAGDATLIKRPCVAVIGSRRVSANGAARARHLARELVLAKIVVASGLAEGVDIEAMRTAVAHDGKVLGVIGTPLDSAYPAQHGAFQEEVYRNHLLISQFAQGERVSPKNFPARNRLMALLSDATIIVEAADNSGTLHQASACVRLSRWLFILRNVVKNDSVTWPARYRSYPKCVVVDRVADVVDRLSQ